MKVLAVLLITVITSVHAFWNGNNTNWSPFGAGTGYNNQAPWGDNSNWNPFSATDARWSPKNDAANLSRYGNRPPVLMQYKKDPRFAPVYPSPVSERRIKPSNWLTDTDFASTLQDFGSQSKNFIVDDFSRFTRSADYARAKEETFGIDRMIRDYAPYKKQTVGNSDNIYGKQGYSLSPAASSTQQIDNK